uniref:Uncharacterized protein n=1 Tax=Trypanosoma congolense (strain IL3000) TaxID=1068625 RepID=G0UPM8_TRYCI|nr:conserved hypothetical protein [Trypanosoma congolense IL3000]
MSCSTQKRSYKSVVVDSEACSGASQRLQRDHADEHGETSDDQEVPIPEPKENVQPFPEECNNKDEFQKQEENAPQLPRSIGRVVEEIVSRLPAPELTEEGKQRVLEIFENSNVRAAAGGCVAKGQKIMSEVKEYQHIAMDAATKAAAQCHERANACTNSAMSTVKKVRDAAEQSSKRVSEKRTELQHRASSYVGTAMTCREKVYDLIEASKPHVSDVSRTGKRALSERDARLFVTALAQIVGCALLLTQAVVEEACKIDRVNSAVDKLQKSPYFQRGLSMLMSMDMTLLQHVPVVGCRMFTAAAAFVDEVKRYAFPAEGDGIPVAHAK